MRRGLLFSFFGLGLIIAFQNCGPQQLQMDFLSGTLVAKSDDAFAMGTSQSVSSGEVTGEAAGLGDSAGPVAPAATQEPVEDGSQALPTDDQNKRSYICILEGEGNSVKVGFAMKNSISKDNTPLDVCMTESACLTIVSQHFPVKTALKRDFCPNNKANVVSFSDDKLQELIQQLNQIQN